MSDQQPTTEPARGRLARALDLVPRALASKPHIVWLILLGVYLIVLPLCGVTVSAEAELIGGNYTNVTSDLGACIAAGGTLSVLRHVKHSRRLAEDAHRLVAELHRHHIGRGRDGEDAAP